MSLALTRLYLEALVEREATEFNADDTRVGLFENDLDPTSETEISDIVTATFGGYSGLLPIQSWPTGSVVWTTPRATITHGPVEWTADGTSTCMIYGYYVVNGSGELIWAERRVDGPISMGVVSGQQYFAIPVYSQRSEFHSS